MINLLFTGLSFGYEGEKGKEIHIKKTILRFDSMWIFQSDFSMLQCGLLNGESKKKGTKAMGLDHHKVVG